MLWLAAIKLAEKENQDLWRAEKYRLRYDRADVIVPAGKIYLNVLEKCGIDEIIVPKIGLSDGIVYYLYKRDN